jgi:hypothetical protein
VLVCGDEAVSLTVACVLVQGEVAYTPEYVLRLRAMVTRWMDRPFEFVCLSDQPRLLPSDMNTVPIQKLSGFAYWSKLELFNPARQWSGRVLYLDLDTLIVAPLAPIVDYPAEFALTDDPTGKARTRDAFGRQIVRRFNSSVMVWNGGTQTYLYEGWTPADADRLSGDQDYLAEQCPDAVGMRREWFPRLSEVTGPPFGEAKVILSKVPKNHSAVDRYPWFAPLWGAA